jgi:glucose-1-phosphate adenylyltransferase
MFDGYWEDIGTVRAFYEANIALGASEPPFQLTSLVAPLYTRARILPPARIRGTTITDSLISDGREICPGSVIENSVIGIRCAIGENVTIRNSVIFGNDVPVTDEKGRQSCNPNAVSIGSGSVIEGAIVDKNARIGERSRIVNGREVQDTDEIDGCMIRDGIPVVLKNTVLPDNWNLSGAF